MTNLRSILSKFNESDNILKYTSHSWDFGQGEKPFNTLEEFLFLVKEEFDTFSEELKQLSPTLYNKIYTFLFNSNNSPWGQNNICFSWSSPDLKNYSKSSFQPQSYILDRKYRTIVDNRSIDRFRDVTSLFKNEMNYLGVNPRGSSLSYSHLRKVNHLKIKFILKK